MNKGKRSIGPKIRLLLAVVIAGFGFFGMHPSIFEDNICKSITTQEFYPKGRVLIANLSPYLVTVEFSGTSNFSLLIRPEYSIEEVMKEGHYVWVAYFNYADYKPLVGFLEVKEDKRSGITIEPGSKKK